MPLTSEQKWNTAHVARVCGCLVPTAARLGVPLQRGADDLDVFDYADIGLPSAVPFRMFKYRGIREDVIDIMFQSQRQDWRDRLNDVLQLLGIERADVLWINEGYFDTP